MAGLVRISAPETTPVDLDEAKKHVIVEHAEDDALIERYLGAATGAAERYLGRALIDQTWDLYLDAFPARMFRDNRQGLAIDIPRPPLIAVEGVFYLDADEIEQEVDAADYVVDAIRQPGRVRPVLGLSWPTASLVANAVRIRFRAGYLDLTVSPGVEMVPDEIKTAILIHVADLYRNRESSVTGERVGALPWSATELLRPYRIHRGFA